MPGEKVAELRRLLQAADSASYAAFSVGEAVAAKGLGLGALAEQGLLPELAKLLQGDSCNDATYYALRAMFGAVGNAKKDIPELAKDPRCLPALLSVLRCGKGSCVAACQHLAAALLWTAAADPAVVGLLGEIDGVTDTLLNSLSPQLDSGIRAATSGALAHMMACTSVCAHLNSLPSALPSIASFLCSLGSGPGSQPQPGSGQQDGAYMRIHGMQVLASSLESSALQQRSSGARALSDSASSREALSRVLLSLLSEAAWMPGAEGGASPTSALDRQLLAMHARCVSAVAAAVVRGAAATPLPSSTEIVASAARLLARQMEVAQAGGTDDRRDSLDGVSSQLCTALCKLAAQLASESSACRTAVGREPGFIAALLRFVSDDVGHRARGAGGAETLAAAVGLLSQVVQDAKMCSKILRGGGKGSSTREPVMAVLARLLAGTPGSALRRAVAQCLREVLNSGEWMAADASAAGEFYGHLSAIMSGLVADVRESQVDLVAGLLAQVILKWVAHRQQPGSAGDGAKIWDSFLQNAVTLMANKKGYRASVLLAHSLRQAVATGGAKAAEAMAGSPSLAASISAGLERGAAAIVALSGDREAEQPAASTLDEAVLAIEVAEAQALFVASLVNAHAPAARTLAADEALVGKVLSIVSSAKLLPGRMDAQVQAASSGACAASAGALGGLLRAGNCRAAPAAAALPSYNLLKCLCRLVLVLPVIHAPGQKGPFGGGARGGAEHVAALLAAVATVAGKDALLSVADAVLDCAGALEALVAMLPQPPVTTGSVQPDADWKNGAVPSLAAFEGGGLAVLRLLHMLAMVPDVALVMADEVDLFPPLLWACLARDNTAKTAEKAAAIVSNNDDMPAPTLAIAIVHLALTTLELSDRQEVLAVPFVMDALLSALESQDPTAAASAVLAVSGLTGLGAFQQLLLVQPARQQISLNRLKLGAPIPTITKAAPVFSRYGSALIKALIDQFDRPASEGDASASALGAQLSPAAYRASVALHKRLHIAWATKQLASERKLCRNLAESEGLVSQLVSVLGSGGRAGGLVAACTTPPGGSGSTCAVGEEELWAMAHLASALADMTLVSDAAGYTVSTGPSVVEGLVRVLQGGCLLPARREDASDGLEDGVSELERRQQAVLEMRMCATRLLGALAQCMLEANPEEASQAAATQKESRAAAGEGVQLRQAEIHERIKGSLEAHGQAMVGACVKLTDKEKNPNLQAEAIYALSCLVAASPCMADMFGATPGSAESCLKVMLAAGKRGIAPDKVNAVAVAAAAATKTLCIASRAGSRRMQEQIAGDSRLGKACAIMLEECSYVRLRQLFPGLHEATAAEDGSAGEGNTSLGDRKGGNKGGKGSIARWSSRLSFSGSIMGSVRSVAMQASGLGSSLLDSGDFENGEAGPAEVKDVRIIVAEIIAKVAAIEGAGSKELLNPKYSILTPLLGLMKMSDVHAATIATSALWALSSTDEGAAAVGSDKREILQHLVKLLKVKRFPAAQANAAGCLASLARLDVNLERMGTLEGCTSGLVALMQTAAQALEDIAQAPPSIGGWPSSVEDAGPDAAVLEDQLVSAAAAIASMSSSGPVAARIASTKGLTQGLAMSLRSQSEMVQLYAAGAMGNLANHTASLAVVTAARGLVRAVVRLASHGKSAQVVETAAGAVRNLAASHRGREELAKEAAVIHTLVALVSKQDDHGRETHLQAQLKAAGALGNLSADRMGLEAMAKDSSGYVASLMKLLVSRQVNKKLARYALVALSNGASHPSIASAMLENPTSVPVFVGNFIACLPLRGGTHSAISSLRQSGTDGDDPLQPSPTSGQAASVAAVLVGAGKGAGAVASGSFIAEVCYLEALRQLAGGSSGSEAHGGAGRVAAAGGMELVGALLEVLREGAAAVVLAEEMDVERQEEEEEEEEEAEVFRGGQELQAKVDMAGASAGVLVHLVMETRRSNDHKLRDMASALEDSLVEATENLLDLLEFERVISEAVPAGRSSLELAHIQILFALWAICTVPGQGSAGQNKTAQEQCCGVLAARPAALRSMADFVQRGTVDEGQNRAAQVFHPARLLAGATLGHMAAAGHLPGPIFSGVVSPDGGGLGKLLLDLLFCPGLCEGDSLQLGAGATGRSLRQVEVDTHSSVEGAIAAAVGASLGEAGMHGGRRMLLVAGAASALGHLSSAPQAVAGVDIAERHARRLAGLLSIAVSTVGSPSMVEGLLTALGGLSAYSPEARTALADLLEDDVDFTGRLMNLIDQGNPWVVQAYAATTIGNLASERPGVAPRLASPTCLASLARTLQAAARRAFPSPDTTPSPTRGDSMSKNRDDVAFTAASVSGCLMNLSQSGVDTAASVAACSLAIDALAELLHHAAAVALGDSSNQVALSCVAYCAATAGALLGAAPATHAAVAEHAYLPAGLVDAVRVPQLDTQRVALMALCGLVPAGAGQKSARLMWGGKSNSEESTMLRDLIDGAPEVRDVLGELTGADDPHVRQNAAWLLSL